MKDFLSFRIILGCHILQNRLKKTWKKVTSVVQEFINASQTKQYNGSWTVKELWKQWETAVFDRFSTMNDWRWLDKIFLWNENDLSTSTLVVGQNFMSARPSAWAKPFWNVASIPLQNWADRSQSLEGAIHKVGLRTQWKGGSKYVQLRAGGGGIHENTYARFLPYSKSINFVVHCL